MAGADAGKRIYAYARWANITDPAKASPWSTLQTTILGD